jgi:hypothetical protein
MNPLALGAHTAVCATALLLWVTGVLPGLAALPIAGLAGVAILAALAVGTVRHQTGRHYQQTGLTGLLQHVLWPREPGRHHRKGHTDGSN